MLTSSPVTLRHYLCNRSGAWKQLHTSLSSLLIFISITICRLYNNNKLMHPTSCLIKNACDSRVQYQLAVEHSSSLLLRILLLRTKVKVHGTGLVAAKTAGPTPPSLHMFGWVFFCFLSFGKKGAAILKPRYIVVHLALVYF